MCTLVLLRRPDHPWPLLMAANRDEMADRPWAPPGRHWADRPEVVAGLDRTGGGSWLGVNDHGLAAAILNRRGSLGPADGKRSRGELVLEALDHADALAAAEALAELNPAAYRSFNLVVADNRDAYWIKNPGSAEGTETARPVEVLPVPEGLSMITAYDLNDPKSPRIARHAGDLREAAAPSPEDGDWSAWQAILARSAESDPGAPAEAAMTVSLGGFQTVSSSLIALAAAPPAGEPPARWLFAAGRPDRHPYEAVDLTLPPALTADKGPVFGGF
ncbi:NRDE family protein [Pelagibius sp.]|uniref:NRDE family protein n=1 Tax=Pelagibius sp. TaxID=1931238 RepID=UPI00261A57CF|nr:NRDE family protein [Pelagibius sp.]